MKKSTLIMTLALILSITLGIGGTMAYLSDTDEDVNVMTLGNVKIDQLEYERVVDKNGAWVSTNEKDEYGYTPDQLQEFTQSKPLYPAVYQDGKAKWDDRNGSQAASGADSHQQSWGQVGAPGSNQLFDDSVKNVIDKFVFVENTGKSEAYFRTIIAIELPEAFDPDLLHTSFNANTRYDWDPNTDDVQDPSEAWEDFMVIDDVRYQLLVATHTEPLAPGAVSRPSVLQFFLDPAATNEDVALFGDTFDVLVVSQAVQTMGFENKGAVYALNTAFGEVTAENNPWSADSDMEPNVTIKEVNDDAGLKAALEATNPNEDVTVKLADGDYNTNVKVPGGNDMTIIGTGEDTVLSGQIASTTSEAGTLTLKNLTINVDEKILDSTHISQTGKSAIAIWGNQTVICENVTFNMSLKDATAITAWWDTGVGTTIIVKNCTFNCNGQRPIRATGNVTVENCTFYDPYRYAVQLTAKASTATLLDKAIINFNNNTIVDGENGKPFVYGIQLEGAEYGCHDCVINGAGNKIVDGGTGSTMYYCECGLVDHDTITWNVVESTPVHEQP